MYFDQFLTNFLRVEYRASRLVEQAREQSLYAQPIAGLDKAVRPTPPAVRSTIALHYDHWINAYQVEFWGTLERLRPVPTTTGSSIKWGIADQLRESPPSMGC